MINYEDSLNIINKNVKISDKLETIDIKNCHKRIVAKNYRASFDNPFFDKSAMDGIVILEQDLKKIKKFTIVGEIRAGEKKKESELNSGEAELIYTGGLIPGKKKKIIIIKEKYKFLSKSMVEINEISKNDFIRRKGIDFKKGNLCLKQNESLNIRLMSLAISLRLKEIDVRVKPKCVVLITGDEISENAKTYEKVPSSNSIFFKVLIEYFGGDLIDIKRVKDNEIDIIKKFESLKGFDLLITSGGLSVGKYDLIKKTLKKKGLKTLFETVAIKPGKPISFGQFKNKSFFIGLPGNPVSCFIGILFFISFFIKKKLGFNKNYFNQKEIKSSNLIIKNNHLTTFLRVKIYLKEKDLFFEIYPNQDSSLLKILSECDGIIIRKPYENEIKPGQKCKLILFNEIKSFGI